MEHLLRNEHLSEEIRKTLSELLNLRCLIDQNNAGVFMIVHNKDSDSYCKCWFDDARVEIHTRVVDIFDNKTCSQLTLHTDEIEKILFQEHHATIHTKSNIIDLYVNRRK